MGFHVDMAELIKLRDAYLKDSTAVQIFRAMIKPQWSFSGSKCLAFQLKYGKIDIEKEVLLVTTPHAEPFKTVDALILFLLKNNRRMVQSSDGYFLSF